MGKHKEEFSIILLSTVCSLIALIYIFYAVVKKQFGVILILAIAMLAIGIVMIITEISILKNKISVKTEKPTEDGEVDTVEE